VGVVLPDSSCFATPGFGDVLSLEDILNAPVLKAGSQTARMMVSSLSRILALRYSRLRNVNEKR
jgi:hypothetical protein